MKHTTLAIESTCDDSSIALVTYNQGMFEVLEMKTHTQGMHATFGGVVPEYASREHAKMLPILLQEMDIDRNRVDSITVAAQPGLPGSIVAGVTAAHSLSHNYGLPVYEVNHIMGHVFSILLDRSDTLMKLPYVCLTVSGGHSDIYLVQEQQGHSQTKRSGDETVFHKRHHMGIGEMMEVGPYRVTKLVQTMDDAVGEAFDKVAKMLGGPYPGGPWIQHIAQKPQSDIYDLLHKRLRKIDISGQFSFSGIKAQVHSLLEYFKRENIDLDDKLIAQVAWMFQERTTHALVSKLSLLIDQYDPKTIGIVGGVSANAVLQEKVASLGKEVYLPTQMKYCTDNAAMIGVIGLITGFSRP